MTYFADCFHTLFQHEIHTGQIAIIDSPEPMNRLPLRFPFLGSKIDWSRTLDHLTATTSSADSNANMERSRFLSQCLAGCNPSTAIFYVNDNALEFTSRWEKSVLLAHSKALFANIPQHHYFFDEQANWCICLSSEGFMDFGRSPHDAPKHAEQ